MNIRNRMTSHQRELARELGRRVNGETAIDVIEVCAKMITFGIYSQFESEELRLQALDVLFDAMRSDLRAPEQRGPLQ